MADDWEEKSLESLCTLITRGSAPVYTGAEGVLVLNQKCIREQSIAFALGRRTDPSKRPIVAERMLRSFDVVVNSTGVGTLGRVAQVRQLPEPATVDSHVTLLRPDATVVDPLYLGMAVRCFEAEIESLGEGSTGQTELSRTRLRSFTVPVPSDRAEQRAIGKILATLDDKIELNRRMNETLEAMARALFKSWFVDFDPVRAKAEGRDPGLPSRIADLFPSSFEASEFGAIPRGWRVQSLGEALSTLEVGGRPKGGVAGYSHGVPSIGAESIAGLGVFDYSKTKYVPRTFFEQMTKGHVQDRDVLLYKDGGRPGEFEPHVTLVGDGFPFREAAINEHVYRIRAEPALGQGFLYFMLSSERVMEEMRVRGTGVAVPGLNSTQVKALRVLVPPPPIVRCFGQEVEPNIARILSSCSEARHLTVVRDALLPKLISGALRVSGAERFVESVTA